ncbi:hypothetical protein V6N13_148160 [Hibiscus sabdariffa]|uniref:Uncharacterized protein n=1 Tax=Hibiscus sabdariffa TaxID=183260 RepID=A0ABR2TYA9_9ROSI
MEEWKGRVQKAGLASADVRLVLSFTFSKISVFYLVETVFPASVAIPLLILLLFPHPNNRRMEVASNYRPRNGCDEKSHSMHYPSQARTTSSTAGFTTKLSPL